MKKLFIFLFLFCILICTPVLAENFYIKNYDVNIKVNKNKSAHVVENIDTYFTTPSHGIFREIPLENANVSNISVSEQVFRDYQTNTRNLKIGNPDRLISGEHHYRISYDYNIMDNKNEFYYNIIGTQWRVPIHNVTFRVQMPEKFDSQKAGLSIGQHGTKGFSGDAVFNIGPDYVSGNTKRTLSPREGITLRIEVPQGYFNKYNNTKGMTVILIMVILTFLSFFTWYMYGKDKPVIPVVNFYPPKGLNSAEVELIYKGHATVKGLVSLIFYLANKGYLKIEEKNSNFEKDYIITRVNNYTGANPVEQAFMNALLHNGNSKTLSSLKTSTVFYKKCEELIKKINKGKTRIFYQNSISAKLISIMSLCLLSIVLLTIYSLFDFNLYKILPISPVFLFPVIAVYVLVATIKQKNFVPIASALIWSLIFGGFPLLFGILPLISINILNLPAIITGFVCIVISTVCLIQLPKRNDFGNRLLGDVLGLKKFIQVAEKNRLESLVEQNPSYVYDVLPYAYVLGVSDKWIKQFESIMTLKPDWYKGSKFTLHTFNNFSNSMNTVSVPSVSNGGISTSSSSGGGGFSGGGCGGGGGGSW